MRRRSLEVACATVLLLLRERFYFSSLTNILIQCDEAQPACRNCQKSKRECLGYDPIFKNPQTGPAAIQPAPSASPSQASTLATANPYGDQAALHAYGQAHNMAYDPALAAGVSSGGAANQFDYASAIDPALEGVASAQPAYQISLPGMLTFFYFSCSVR